MLLDELAELDLFDDDNQELSEEELNELLGEGDQHE